MANKVLVSNRRAHADYKIFEKQEAGIEFKGSEVKSLREGKGSLAESFARIENGEIFLYNCHISPYSHKGYDELDPLRIRRLLLHKREISKLYIQVSQRGFTLIPLRLYLSKGLIKVEIALCKGKKHFDKRESIKKREQDLSIRRALRYRR
ncbi:MAG: SsrA-binding protein SmpB [Candidatus Omnitrophica bacterium]|nr:SsrA-binding protein SmpB [Candidatus Omnitrophota bacterium]